MFNTFIECVCSTFFSVLIGFIYAYAIVFGKIPFRKFFSLIPIIHLVTPPFVGGLAFILLFGRQGFFTKTLFHLDVSLYGFWGLLISQTLCFFPISYLISLQTLNAINPNLIDAARNMGSGRREIFWKIILPLSKTSLASSALFIAVSVLSDFGNPLIVGGRFKVLSVEIYTQLTGWLDSGTSAALGIVLLFPSIILFFLQAKLAKLNEMRNATIGMKGGTFRDINLYDNSKKYTPSFAGRYKFMAKNIVSKILLTLFCAIISFFVLAQFISIVAGSFQKLWGVNTALTFEHIKQTIKYLRELLNSVGFALFSAILSAFFACIVSFIVHRTNLPLKKFFDTVAQIPSAIPGTLFGLSLSLFSNAIDFHSSKILIIVAITISFLPFSYRIISSTFLQIRKTLDDASSSLGETPLGIFRTIIVPLSSDGIFSGFIYNFARGVGTVSTVIFLVSFDTPLASVAILNLAEQGDWGKSAALAFILTIITFAVLGIGKFMSDFCFKRKVRV